MEGAITRGTAAAGGPAASDARAAPAFRLRASATLSDDRHQSVVGHLSEIDRRDCDVIRKTRSTLTLGRALVLSWARVPGAARYRVEVLAGRRRVAARTLSRTRLRVARPPAGRLRVEVLAVSGEGAASPPARATVGRRRR